MSCGLLGWLGEEMSNNDMCCNYCHFLPLASSHVILNRVGDIGGELGRNKKASPEKWAGCNNKRSFPHQFNLADSRPPSLTELSCMDAPR